MQKGQTGILILAGIVLVLAVAGGIFYLGRATAPAPKSQAQNVATPSPQQSSTPDQTVYTESDRSSNWKTYVNTNYQFSIKYPPSWFISEYKGDKVLSGDHPQAVVSFYNKQSEGITIGDPDRIEVNIIYFKPTISASEFLNKLVSEGKLKLERNNVYIGEDREITSRVGFIIKNDTNEIYEIINAILKEGRSEEAKDYFNQILPTFRFLP